MLLAKLVSINAARDRGKGKTAERNFGTADMRLNMLHDTCLARSFLSMFCLDSLHLDMCSDIHFTRARASIWSFPFWHLLHHVYGRVLGHMLRQGPRHVFRYVLDMRLDMRVDITLLHHRSIGRDGLPS